jgi:hypothetical protein
MVGQPQQSLLPMDWSLDFLGLLLSSQEDYDMAAGFPHSQRAPKTEATVFSNISPLFLPYLLC